jgi:uncharacterized protein YceK
MKTWKYNTIILTLGTVLGLLLLLSGCSTVVPVTAKFPEEPKRSEACPQLQKLNDGAKLSDVSTTININYSTYYECAVKVDSWNEWYQIQKRIFEGVK